MGRASTSNTPLFHLRRRHYGTQKEFAKFLGYKSHTQLANMEKAARLPVEFLKRLERNLPPHHFEELRQAYPPSDVEWWPCGDILCTPSQEANLPVRCLNAKLYSQDLGELERKAHELLRSASPFQELHGYGFELRFSIVFPQQWTRQDVASALTEKLSRSPLTCETAALDGDLLHLTISDISSSEHHAEVSIRGLDQFDDDRAPSANAAVYWNSSTPELRLVLPSSFRSEDAVEELLDLPLDLTIARSSEVVALDEEIPGVIEILHPLTIKHAWKPELKCRVFPLVAETVRAMERVAPDLRLEVILPLLDDRGVFSIRFKTAGPNWQSQLERKPIETGIRLACESSAVRRRPISGSDFEFGVTFSEGVGYRPQPQ